MTAELAPFLPAPVVVREGETYRLDYDRPRSIGRMRSFYGNFGILVRAYAYILSMGGAGLRRASEMAVLNANYVRARLEGTYHLPYKTRSLHEVVFSDRDLGGDCHTLDLAKRLIDYGYHPPTIYFPLVVKGAIMIEPTETESKEFSTSSAMPCSPSPGRRGRTRSSPPGAGPHPHPTPRRDRRGAKSDVEVGMRKGAVRPLFSF